jgi:dTDP-4-amino-4,6-dideoxygalactose transaminase
VKTITTGEGGAVLTNNEKFAKCISRLRSHGIIRGKNYWDYDIKDLGFNYRLSDINCALGYSQLKKIGLFFKKRKIIFDLYKKKLKPYDDFFYFPKVKNKYNLYHLFLIGMNFKKIKKNKNSFIKFLNKKGIFPQFHYKPIFQFSFFKNKNLNKFPGSIKYYKNYISLPIYYSLSKKHQMYIISNIIKYLKNNKK